MTRPQRQVGGRVVTDVPDYGTPPPAPIEDAPVAPEEEAGLHPLLAVTDGTHEVVGVTLPTGQFVPSPAYRRDDQPAEPEYRDGTFGPNVREAWRQAKERGDVGWLERALARLSGRPVPPRPVPLAEALAAGGVLDSPTLAELGRGPVACTIPAPADLGPALEDGSLHQQMMRAVRDAEEHRLVSLGFTPEQFHRMWAGQHAASAHIAQQEEHPMVPDDDAYTGPETLPDSVVGGLVAALNEATRPGPRPARELCDTDGHMWIEERSMCSREVERLCSRCGARDSYTDTFEI